MLNLLNPWPLSPNYLGEELLFFQEVPMNQDVYERLAQHLDTLPAGFPKTESGVELRILKRHFTEEEAELACHLTSRPEPVEKIARRADRSEDELTDKLYQMSLKGLIFRVDRDEGNLYMAAQYVVGIYEYQVNNLDPALIQDTEEYVPVLLDALTRIKTQQFRTIPIGASLEGKGTVLPYEEARKLIAEQSKLLVAPCICRKESNLVGKGCGKPLDTCLIFGAAANYYEKNQIGRSITQEEALEILSVAEKEALVLQSTNAQKIINICLCCGDCCQVLKTLNRHPKPAEVIRPNYTAQVQAEDCLGCEICLDRCQVQALEIKEGLAEVDPDRCIGCGLCVPTCSGQAIELRRKEESHCTIPPVHVQETYLRMASERGRLK
jgi:electron transport complex protein RnfB